jgi:hypothetical protein
MKERCCNPACRVFGRYGGRGIRVCGEWLRSYESFLACVGRRPGSPTGRRRSMFSLGRIDNDGDYEPGNVEWQTQFQQVHNRGPIRRRVA